MITAPVVLGHLGDGWPLGPLPLLALGLAGLVYRRALVVWRHRTGRLPAGRRHVAAFVTGLGTLAVALSSPFERMAAESFAAHMVQHLLLILVVAPLIVAGRPVTVVTRALPPSWRRARWPALIHLRTLAEHPVVVWTAATAGLWAWHTPALYQLALRHPAVHVAEHLTFLGTAAWFWTQVLAAGRPRSRGETRPARSREGTRRLGARPVALALTFATAMASGALGAVLTFAGAPLYPEQAARAAAAGLSPLEDQQLAGALMWMPPGLVYLATMATLLVRWFADLDAHAGREASPAPVGGRVR